MKGKFAFLCLPLMLINLALTASGLDDYMTREEQNATGVDQLSPSQKKSLSQWLEKNVQKKVPESTPPGKKPLTLSENRSEGKMIILSDGSRWQIAPEDVDRSSLWLTPFPIRIEKSDDNPQYPYKIINTYTGSSVHAQKIEPEENS